MITYFNYNIASSLLVSAFLAPFLEQHPAISQSSPEKLHQQDLYIERCISRNWLTLLWELASLKFIGQPGDPGKS